MSAGLVVHEFGRTIHRSECHILRTVMYEGTRRSLVPIAHRDAQACVDSSPEWRACGTCKPDILAPPRPP